MGKLKIINMKKILFILLAFMALNASSQSLPPNLPNLRPLSGTYIEIVSDTSLRIYATDGIFSKKTFPTNFYWVYVDNHPTIDIHQVDTQGFADITFTFSVYWDYYSYRNYYDPYVMKNPTSFTIKNVDFSQQFAITDSLDTWIIRGLSQYFNNYNKTKLLPYSY
jgi:hypothetical protein